MLLFAGGKKNQRRNDVSSKLSRKSALDFTVPKAMHAQEIVNPAGLYTVLSISIVSAILPAGLAALSLGKRLPSNKM